MNTVGHGGVCNLYASLLVNGSEYYKEASVSYHCDESSFDIVMRVSDDADKISSCLFGIDPLSSSSFLKVCVECRGKSIYIQYAYRNSDGVSIEDRGQLAELQSILERPVV